MARKGHGSGDEPPIPATARPAYDTIVSLTDAFCQQQLNEEYETLCRKLAGALARKRPSPLLGGKPTTWACRIIRTIGWVNYLDDRSNRPHLKLTAIDKAFGVAESTGQGKSKLIRDMLKIRTFDARWTLPSQMDRNPTAWMIEINGLIVDARYLKREFQEEAFRKGLIPYVPEKGGGTGEAPSCDRLRGPCRLNRRRR
jgi:hypothetical protein